MEYHSAMVSRFDLHSHSTASDGALSPSALVRRAAGEGVRVLALTDHDTTDGIPEAQGAADSVGIHLVPGVEISTDWGERTIHILGLGIDPEAPSLKEGLAELRRFRVWRAEEMGRQLERAGIPRVFAQAQTLARGSILGRAHFAQVLVGLGYGTHVGAIFHHFLVRGKPGYVPGRWAHLDTVLSWIQGAGGQAVIAHPHRYGFPSQKMLHLLAEFKERGGVGIEIISGNQNPDDTQILVRYARRYALRASLGSDYHGLGASDFGPGQLPPLPEQVVPIWRDWGLSL